MMNGKKIIAILPAYNAEKTLLITVQAIPKDIIDEIILVDDASTDRTVAVAQELGLTVSAHEKNLGYGANQKTCYALALEAGADVVVMVHPDFQYDPASIPDLVSPIVRGETDAVFGSRMLIPKNALAGGMPLWKYIANKFLTIFENRILHLNLSEYHSGFRAYSKDVLETVPFELNSDGFVFDTEIIVQIKCAGFTIQEIPIATRYFPEASMIGLFKSIQYGFHIVWTMLRYTIYTCTFKKILQFNILIKNPSLRCVQCRNKRIIVWKEATGTIQEILSSSSYLITESYNNIHDTIFLCLSCDCRFVDRSHIQEILKKQYTEQSFDEEYMCDKKWRQKCFRKILKNLSPPAEDDKKKFLDVGCGPGLFLKEAEKQKFEVYGIELSQSSVQYAREILRLPRITQGGSEDIDTQYPDAFFDIICAIDVFEHVLDPALFLSVVHKKLKPTGIVCFTLLMGDSFFARLSGNKWYAFLPSHLQYYSKKSLTYLCDSFGFKPLSYRYHVRYLSVSYLMQKILGHSFAIQPLWLRNIGIPINFFDTRIVYLTKQKDESAHTSDM